MKWYNCSSAHGTRLVIRSDSTLGHSVHEHDPKVYIYVPDPNASIAFIVPSDIGRRFCVLPSAYHAPAISVILKVEKTPISITLADERQYLAAEPPTNDGSGLIFANRKFARAWELFLVTEVPNDQLPENVFRFSQSVRKLFQNRFSASSLMAALSEQLDWFALESCLPLVRMKEKRELARLFVRDPFLVDVIQQKFAHDQWATVALNDLATWVGGTENTPPLPRKTYLGTQFDWLGHRYLPERYRGLRPISATEILVRSAREVVTPKHRACVLATARNEGVYFLEWIAYHRAIGFEQFFIYTNGNDDFSNVLLDILAKEKIIHVIYSELGPKQNAQGKAYGHALGFLPQILDYEWTLVCDLDEFIVLDSKYFTNIEQYLCWHEISDLDCINLSWRHIGGSGQRKWNDKPMFDRFNTDPFWMDTKVKSIFKTARAAQSYAHFPVELEGRRFVFRNAVGDIRQTFKSEEIHGIHGRHLDDDPDYRFGNISHYYWKSAEEFLWKHSRNKGDHGLVEYRSIDLIHPAEVEHYLRYFGTTPVSPQPSDARVLARDFDLELSRLRGLSGIAEAEELIKLNFKQTISRLKQEFLTSDQLTKMGGIGQSFAALLE